METPKSISHVVEKGREEQNGYMMQAGRSDSALGAERTVSLIRKESESLSVSSADTKDGDEVVEQVQSGTSNESGERGRKSLVRRVSNGDKFPHKSNRLGTTLIPKQQSLHQKASSELGSGAPKRLKDLGRDYSRYPVSGDTSPIASRGQSRKASTSEPRTRSQSQSSSSSSEGVNPFSNENQHVENWSYPDDSITSFAPYYGGEKGFILFKDEIEEDDEAHTPRDDDDLVYKPKASDYFGRRAIISTVGALCLVLGLFVLFAVLPILTWLGVISSYGPGVTTTKDPASTQEDTWATVNHNVYPILKNVRTGLIDPDTPDHARTRKSTFDDEELKLVFSDEFNENNRTFYPGDDPYWTAANIWYGATQDFEWYDPDAVTTYDGTLQMRLDKFSNHNLLYRSGMLNSWNQMCFKGGVFEVSLSLAGPSGVPGLWPGVWSMGNLGRPGYGATTEGVWPYTYDSCDVGITPNQSSPDGLSYLPGQKLASCTCPDEDHPSPGTGRGAPEIDVLEASVDPQNRIGVVTQSFQVAPFDVLYRPNSEFLAIPNYNTTQMNAYCGGPFQQAISGTTLLNNKWYDGNQYQKYAFEYEPGTSNGKIAWFVGEDPSFVLDGRAIGPNGNVKSRQVSEEPMSMVLNLGFSGSWSEILLADLKFPTVLQVDYVRIYQREGQESVTCDPPGYPTTEYIKNHPIAYMNPNLTNWNDTGYGWPKNKMQHQC